MEQVLQVRQAIVSFCKRYEVLIVFAFKFLFGLIVFSMISGIDRPVAMLARFSGFSRGLPYTLLMSLIFAATPINAGYLLITLNLCLQTSAVLQVSLLLGVFLLAVQGLYTRLAPEECVLILVMIAAYYFKLPYLVPILAGMYFSLTAMIPIAIAVFMWQFFPMLLGMFKAGGDTVFSVGGLTEMYQASYTQVVGAVMGNQDWVVISFVFAMVVMLVYIISHAAIDYAKDIAIALGGVMTIIGLLIVSASTDIEVGMGGVFLSTIASVAIAYAVRFFDVLLDYNRAERVQFEDEENVYYVKIVPKIVIGEQAAGTSGAAGSELVRIAEPADDLERERAERRSDWSARWEQIERERESERKSGR